MKAFSLRVIALASLPAFGACADTGTTEPTGPGFEITVAPLQLTNIGDACYDILVENASGDDVVSLTNICASQYGNQAGGDITYIAPCDATTATNTVTLWPSLHTAAPGTEANELTDWRNPCDTTPGGAIEGCQVVAACNENEDTLVEFNLTIMREANQGFFDVAVNFSDIFCSAKVDCKYDDNSPIRLVHGTDGQRTASTVVALACTDGNFGATSTTLLYASNVQIDCAGTTNDLVISTDTAGNVYPIGTAANSVVEQAIVFMGAEDLLNGGAEGQPANKVYWNTAIGFAEVGAANPPQLVAGGESCTLRFTATASQGALNLTSNGYLSHPFMTATVPLTNSSGVMTCGQHPINSAAFVTNYDDAFPGTLAWTLNGTQADAGQAQSFTPPAP